MNTIAQKPSIRGLDKIARDELAIRQDAQLKLRELSRAQASNAMANKLGIGATALIVGALTGDFGLKTIPAGDGFKEDVPKPRELVRKVAEWLPKLFPAGGGQSSYAGLALKVELKPEVKTQPAPSVSANTLPLEQPQPVKVKSATKVKTDFAEWTPCPWPENVDSRNRRAGGRSAMSRGGGLLPIRGRNFGREKMA